MQTDALIWWSWVFLPSVHLRMRQHIAESKTKERGRAPSDGCSDPNNTSCSWRIITRCITMNRRERERYPYGMTRVHKIRKETTQVCCWLWLMGIQQDEQWVMLRHQSKWKTLWITAYEQITADANQNALKLGAELVSVHITMDGSLIKLFAAVCKHSITQHRIINFQ